MTDEVQVTRTSMLEAYSKGIMPFYIGENGKMRWYIHITENRTRGMLMLKDLHVDKETKKWLRRNELPVHFGKKPGHAGVKELLPYEVTFDTAFEAVVRACMNQARFYPDGSPADAWMSEDHVRNYLDLFSIRAAHSVEVWVTDKSGRRTLVGGLFGIFVKGVFSGESMFHLVNEDMSASDAAKIAFVKLSERLQDHGSTFIDMQMVSTEAFARMGNREIPIETYWNLLADEQKRNISFFK